jgi:hypothetical protein
VVQPVVGWRGSLRELNMGGDVLFSHGVLAFYWLGRVVMINDTGGLVLSPLGVLGVLYGSSHG